MQIFVTALFIIAERWNNPNVVSIKGNWINVIYPRNGISFGRKQEWNADTCHNTQEIENMPSRKCQSEDHALYDSIYRVVKNRKTYRGRKIVSPGAEGTGGSDCKGAQSFFGGIIKMSNN